MEWSGIISYLLFMATLIGIYSLMTLGLNIQWGMSGLLNIGIVAFFAVGAYTSAILTAAPATSHLGGFDLPIILVWPLAALISMLLALIIGLITIRLRGDYLAIATIGLAEVIRLLLKNEDWLTNGVRGIVAISHPFGNYDILVREFLYALLVGILVLGAFYMQRHLGRSPWGRTQRLIREHELAALVGGKNINRFRLEAFVIGSSLMGLAGACYANFVGFISPEAFDPMITTFLVWVMLIVGGSNTIGPIVGSAIIWTIWVGTEYLGTYLPSEWSTQIGAIRLLMIGLLLIIMILYRPQGLFVEKSTVKDN